LANPGSATAAVITTHCVDNHDLHWLGVTVAYMPMHREFHYIVTAKQRF